MTYQFQTSDLVCSRMIEIELDDRGERVKRVQVVGGCPGTLAGIGRLAAGMTPEELIDRLQGIRCGGKPELHTARNRRYIDRPRGKLFCVDRA